MKQFKIIFAAAFFLALAGIGLRGALVAHADSEACAVSPSDIQQLKSIQSNSNLSYADELSQELALRKQLLSETITCAKSQAQNLQASLQAVSAPAGTAGFKDQLSGKLDDASNFYDLELGKLNGAGISASQAVASEVLAWRKGSYDPLAGDVNNFILWSGNQSLFDVAQTRFDQTDRAVSFLEDASPNTDLENAFLAAKTSFQNAKDQNQAAENALTQFFPPDQSLALIKQSLASLSDTYQKFFDVSSLIKTLLPPQQ